MTNINSERTNNSNSLEVRGGVDDSQVREDFFTRLSVPQDNFYNFNNEELIDVYNAEQSIIRQIQNEQIDNPNIENRDRLKHYLSRAEDMFKIISDKNLLQDRSFKGAFGL